jgi:hypothetical protein
MKNTSMKRLCSFSLIITLLFSHTVFAWSSVGHRLTAAVALYFVEENTAERLITLLEQHPRFEQDFLNAMPASIASSDNGSKQQWLLGQAAYWPDIARGLPDTERAKYNRGSWHYEQGEWIRGAAQLQGNHYIGIEPFPSIEGHAGDSIRSEDAVGNLVTAIDYNTWVVANTILPLEQRAVALCWVLHLIGDIHQPLHTGSLYSADTFERGDLGGNRIPTGELNLHARWDQALEKAGIAGNLPLALEQVSGFNQPKIKGVESDWTQWMSESRQHLQTSVYTAAMLAAAKKADANGDNEMLSTELPDGYIEEMKRISLQRIGLAGLRLAIWFENTLP